MIINSAGTQAISTLGWADKSSFWVCSNQKSTRQISFGNANFLSIKEGKNDLFAVVHHHDGKTLEITAHSHLVPDQVISQISFRTIQHGGMEILFTGESKVWEQLPCAFTAFLQGDYQLIFRNPSGKIEVQRFGWYGSASYDKGYQGIVGATEIPNSHLLIVSIQRDSAPVLHDPIKNILVRKLKLADRGGNPTFRLRSKTNELCASDYDSLVKLDVETLEVLNIERIQDASSGRAQFMGEFCFDADERLCLVARPFSGDIVVLDADSMRSIDHIAVGRQPLDISLFANDVLAARDWKTGDFLWSCYSPK